MNNQEYKEPKLRDTFKEDFKRKDLFETLRKEFHDLKQYFLDDYKKEQLRRMNFVKRFFVQSWWLLKILFLRLTPLRRVLLLIGVILIVSDFNIQYQHLNFNSNNDIIGGLLILFVLMLELKDKLLAKTELQEGKSVQKALMPAANPEIDGWDICLKSFPANDVGGDLIDFFKIDDKKYALILGDLSGKGLGAALMMSKLQSTIRALYQDFNDISKLAEKVNQIFYRDSLPKQFASLIYMVLNTADNTLEIVNAGHLPPLMVENGEIKSLGKGGIAIGLSKNSSYSKQILLLKDNDELLVFSDGVTETMNEYDQQFGIKRLIKLIGNLYTLNSKSQMDRIISNLNLYRGNASIHDDVSLLIIKKQSSHR